MRMDMKVKIHDGHLGIEKCKFRARETLFWPGMNMEITEIIKGCSECQEYRKYQQKEPLMQHNLPTKPWGKVATDLFKFQNNDFGIIVDCYSNYPEIAKLDNTSGEQVTKKLKSISSRHGTTREVIQTIKQLLKKATKKGKDLHIAVQAHRACPDPNRGPSSTERRSEKRFEQDFHHFNSTSRHLKRTTSTS